jgi:membrane associated rhomboid family serine protease
MYPPRSSQQADSGWEYPSLPPSDAGRLSSALPKPPAYLPPPVPPSPPAALLDFSRPQRLTFRIPSERPVLTLAILALLVIIYIPTLLYPNVYEWAILNFALYKPAIADGEWWRLFTATLLHSSMIWHILFNGYALYVIGMDLEAFFGRWRFAAIYLISALGGSVTSFAFSAAFAIQDGQSVPIYGFGASGAIFGLIGALAVFFGLNRSLFGKRGNFQFWNIIVVIVLNLGLGLSGIFPVDNWAHTGGLVTGAAVGFVLCPRYRLGGWYNPLVRQVVNTNKSLLSWVATVLIALDVILFFFVALLIYRQGFVLPTAGR